MNPGTALTPAARERARVRSPLLLLSAAVWMLLVEMGHGPTAMIDPMLAAVRDRGVGFEMVVSAALDWALMVVAMMAPLLVAPVCHVRARSFTWRRPRAIGLFLSGYVAAWTVAGLALTALCTAVLLTGVALPIVVAALVVVAAVWQCSPLKQRCLNRIRSHPELAAFGGAASLGALRFGTVHAVWCVGSCWALMLLTVLSPWGIPVMLAVMLWFLAERLDRLRRPSWRVRVPGTVARLTVVRVRTSFGSAGVSALS